MKRVLKKVVLAAIVVAVAGFFSVGLATAGTIVGSDHDFSSSSWSGGEVCKVCHTPHGAVNGEHFLWNHELTAATYTLYNSPKLNAALGQPSGESKACLSCHDGTVAIDSYGGATGTNMITGDSDLGTDLSNDHPVSFTFDAALKNADGELNDPTAGEIPGMLSAGKVECASCHDVHNTKGQDHLLIKSNAGSALCLTCHNK